MVRPMTWYVYVIVNAARIAYTGIAADVTARLAQHNGEKRGGAKFTRGRGPWRIAHVEGPLTKSDALKREAAIKKDRAFKRALKTSPIRRTP